MSTNSYYSSASSSGFRVCPPGVPSKCWCGEEIITFTSKTKENPYRRFYRCAIAMKRENEEHLFKWVDEALLDEIKMVNEKCKRVVENISDLRMNVMANMELLNKNAKQMEEELIKKMEGELLTMKENVEELGHVMAKSALKTVGVAVVIVASIVWLWGRV
ncbi:zinc ion binding protein [Arabidopsis thaliana]|uniref:Uncharacterized protein At4g04775 n=1 Tax=Arabidopsis thaliana TaxID=3702 RepID=Y4478_ARATH|nr:zinc ion binding protein [Arabidopsis thaliana]Q9ZS96.1 RecName: Full=Uncharacterized protein At4g04775 [Arabidopsis thaliana]AAD03442.1 T4B21.8 gene product [Arabidopsis thaliana]AEE82424.2 zinc ion binding protein [Arabidopsis thaliana]|eukprot:NP_001190673.2 zinc ion binding protein [Arabidopsis thaliana]